MILKFYGRYYIPVCDCCEKYLDREWDFEDAVGAIRAAGWSSRKEGDTWVNYCEECSAAMNSARNEFDD